MKKRKFFLSILSFLLIFATIFPQGSLFAKAEGREYESTSDNITTYSLNYSKGGHESYILHKKVEISGYGSNIYQDYYLGKNVTKNGDGTWTVTIGLNNEVDISKSIYSSPQHVTSDILFVFDTNSKISFEKREANYSDIYNSLDNVRKEVEGYNDYVWTRLGFVFTNYSHSFQTEGYIHGTSYYYANGQSALLKDFEYISTYLSRLSSTPTNNSIDNLDKAATIIDKSSTSPRKVIIFVTDGNSTNDSSTTTEQKLAELEEKYNANICVVYYSNPDNPGNKERARSFASDPDLFVEWTNNTASTAFATAVDKATLTATPISISRNGYFTSDYVIEDAINTEYFEIVNSSANIYKINYTGKNIDEFPYLGTSVNEKRFNWKQKDREYLSTSYQIGDNDGKISIPLSDFSSEYDVIKDAVTYTSIYDKTAINDKTETLSSSVDRSEYSGSRFVVQFKIKLKDVENLPKDGCVFMFTNETVEVRRADCTYTIISGGKPDIELITSQTYELKHDGTEKTSGDYFNAGDAINCSQYANKYNEIYIDYDYSNAYNNITITYQEGNNSWSEKKIWYDSLTYPTYYISFPKYSEGKKFSHWNVVDKSYYVKSNSTCSPGYKITYKGSCTLTLEAVYMEDVDTEYTITLVDGEHEWFLTHIVDGIETTKFHEGDYAQLGQSPYSDAELFIDWISIKDTESYTSCSYGHTYTASISDYVRIEGNGIFYCNRKLILKYVAGDKEWYHVKKSDNSSSIEYDDLLCLDGFDSGSSFTEWNTEPDGSGETYYPKQRIYLASPICKAPKSSATNSTNVVTKGDLTLYAITKDHSDEYVLTFVIDTQQSRQYPDYKEYNYVSTVDGKQTIYHKSTEKIFISKCYDTANMYPVNWTTEPYGLGKKYVVDSDNSTSYDDDLNLNIYLTENTTLYAFDEYQLRYAIYSKNFYYGPSDLVTIADVPNKDKENFIGWYNFDKDKLYYPGDTLYLTDDVTLSAIFDIDVIYIDGDDTWTESGFWNISQLNNSAFQRNRGSSFSPPKKDLDSFVGWKVIKTDNEKETTTSEKIYTIGEYPDIYISSYNYTRKHSITVEAVRNTSSATIKNETSDYIPGETVTVDIETKPKTNSVAFSLQSDSYSDTYSYELYLDCKYLIDPTNSNSPANLCEGDSFDASQKSIVINPNGGIVEACGFWYTQPVQIWTDNIENIDLGTPKRNKFNFFKWEISVSENRTTYKAIWAYDYDSHPATWYYDDYYFLTKKGSFNYENNQQNRVRTNTSDLSKIDVPQYENYRFLGWTIGINEDEIPNSSLAYYSPFVAQYTCPLEAVLDYKTLDTNNGDNISLGNNVDDIILGETYAVGNYQFINMNGGYCTISGITYTDSIYGLSPFYFSSNGEITIVPQRNGYDFVKWERSTSYFPNSANILSYTDMYYPIWKKSELDTNIKTIYVNLNGGSCYYKEKQYTNSFIVEDISLVNTLKKDNDKFAGWILSENSENNIQTFTAQWESKKSDTMVSTNNQRTIGICNLDDNYTYKFKLKIHLNTQSEADSSSVKKIVPSKSSITFTPSFSTYVDDSIQIDSLSYAELKYNTTYTSFYPSYEELDPFTINIGDYNTVTYHIEDINDCTPTGTLPVYDIYYRTNNNEIHTVANNTLKLAGYTATGWADNEDLSVATLYKAGDEIEIKDEDIDLYSTFEEIVGTVTQEVIEKDDGYSDYMPGETVKYDIYASVPYNLNDDSTATISVDLPDGLTKTSLKKIQEVEIDASCAKDFGDEYTIKVDPNGGEWTYDGVSYTSPVVLATRTLVLDNPTKHGTTFNKWVVTQDGNQKTYTALWKDLPTLYSYYNKTIDGVYQQGLYSAVIYNSSYVDYTRVYVIDGDVSNTIYSEDELTAQGIDKSTLAYQDNFDCITYDVDDTTKIITITYWFNHNISVNPNSGKVAYTKETFVSTEEAQDYEKKTLFVNKIDTTNSKDFGDKKTVTIDPNGGIWSYGNTIDTGSPFGFDFDETFYCFNSTFVFTAPVTIQTENTEFGEPVKSGYTFTGWTITENGNNTKYTANWEETVIYPASDFVDMENSAAFQYIMTNYPELMENGPAEQYVVLDADVPNPIKYDNNSDKFDLDFETLTNFECLKGISMTFDENEDGGIIWTLYLHWGHTYLCMPSGSTVSYNNNEYTDTFTASDMSSCIPVSKDNDTNFVGWFVSQSVTATEEESSSSEDDSYIPSSQTVFIPYFYSDIATNITINPNGGEVTFNNGDKTTETTTSNKISSVKDITKENDTFLGWAIEETKNENFGLVTNITYTAQWISNISYTDSISVPNINDIDKIYKDNDSFTGWIRTVNEDTGDILYTAQWLSTFENSVEVEPNATNHFVLEATVDKNVAANEVLNDTVTLNFDADGDGEFKQFKANDAPATVADYHTVTYKMAYNGNEITDAEAPTDTNLYRKGDNITIQNTDHEQEGTTFQGWTTDNLLEKLSPSLLATTYKANETAKMGNEDLILYSYYASEGTTLPETGSFEILLISACSLTLITLSALLYKKRKNKEKTREK